MHLQGSLFLTAAILTVLVISLFGILCIVRPKFGNLSRAMGLLFLGTAAAFSTSQLHVWRLFIVSVGVLGIGLLWCGVEFIKLPKVRH
jgi:uncharacterized membrane protein